jgi:hypothetical protein
VIHREWFLRRADRAKEINGIIFWKISAAGRYREEQVYLFFDYEPRRGEWRKIVHNFSTTTLLKKAELKEIGRESYFLNMS